MSWARDEWKLDLPTAALRKISELENEAENLRKSKQQQQFQLESVSSTLQKQKQLNAEEKASNSSLRREIQELSRKCSDLEGQEEKTQLDLKAKDTKIVLLEEQLRKAKAKLKDEEDNNSELLNQINQQTLVAEAKENEIGELSEELERTKDAKAQMMKDMEGRFLQFSFKLKGPFTQVIFVAQLDASFVAACSKLMWYRGDKSHRKSHLITRAILKLQLKRDKNCIELPWQKSIACVNGP